MSGEVRHKIMESSLGKIDVNFKINWIKFYKIIGGFLLLGVVGLFILFTVSLLSEGLTAQYIVAYISAAVIYIGLPLIVGISIWRFKESKITKFSNFALVLLYICLIVGILAMLSTIFTSEGAAMIGMFGGITLIIIGLAIFLIAIIYSYIKNRGK